MIDIIQQGTVNAFLAMGITVAIITAGIDLSVGSTMAVVLVACAMLISLADFNPVLTIVVGIVIGAFIGVDKRIYCNENEAYSRLSQPLV